MSGASGPQLSIRGTRTTGQDVRTQNTMAVQAVANILKTSLGPVGLDKMLVDDIGDVTITNDGATILKLLEVEHPAAKILVDLAALQDSEVGDGTTSVVILAAELLRRGNDLVRSKVHPTSILAGYRQAMREAVRVIEEQLSIATSELPEDALVNAAKTSMSSKVLGGDSDMFARLCVDAVRAIGTREGEDALGGGGARYPLRNIGVLKAPGGALRESTLIRGVALAQSRAAQGMPKAVGGPARVACIDFDLSKARMHTGVSVVVSDPTALEGIRAREADIARDRALGLVQAGARVVLTTRGIDDATLKVFVEHGVIAARRVPREDVRRAARATGATLLTTLADAESGETCPPEALGVALGGAEEVRVGDNDILVLRTEPGEWERSREGVSHGVLQAFIEGDRGRAAAKGDDAAAASVEGAPPAEAAEAAPGPAAVPALHPLFAPTLQRKALGGATVLLRGGSDHLLDEADRALHDALCVVKRVLESGQVVPGGGAVEAALSVSLERLATTLSGREQLAVAEFADALLVIPKTLAVNAAKDATDLVARLRAYHHAAQTRALEAAAGVGTSAEELAKSRVLARSGLDLVEGTVRDAVEAGVLEPSMSKVKALRFATEAAITILRIDDLIRLEPEPEAEEEG